MTELMKEMRLDISELKKLFELSERRVVKDELHLALKRAETRLTHENEKLIKETSKTTNSSLASRGGGDSFSKKRYVKDIQTYAWDQSDKFMKIYVSLAAVQDINSENITCSFDKRSIKLYVSDLDGKDHSLNIVNLHSDIIPGDSYYKVKKDTVLVMLKKLKPSEKWSHMKKQQEKKETKAPTNNDDPSSGIMDMLKNIYDSGDDNMKRTINKAWSESRDKKGGGMPEMPEMP